MLFQRKHQTWCKLKMRQSLNKQKGVVIVIALFIVALIATMAYAMMSRLARDTKRTTLILRDTQAGFYALGSIEWARDQLRNNFERQKADRLVDAMPIQSPAESVNGYTIKSTIYDMQSKYNINNLATAEAFNDFIRLLRAVDNTLTEEKAHAIVLAIHDWIKPGNTANEYKRYYAELPIPYTAAHRPMISISELQLVKGITPSLFAALKPHVTALPVTAPINVQTADAIVLTTLSPNITLETAKAIVQQREGKPFTSPQVFLGLDMIKNHPVPADKITTVSSYFLVETEIGIENQHLLLYTLLERATNQNKINTNTLWQSKGIW